MCREKIHPYKQKFVAGYVKCKILMPGVSGEILERRRELGDMRNENMVQLLRDVTSRTRVS